MILPQAEKRRNDELCIKDVWEKVYKGRIDLVLKPLDNLGSVATRMFRTRRARAGIVALRQASATRYWAFWLPPAGRAHKLPSALLPLLDVAPRCLRSSASHMAACGLADPELSSGLSTTVLRIQDASKSGPDLSNIRPYFCAPLIRDAIHTSRHCYIDPKG